MLQTARLEREREESSYTGMVRERKSERETGGWGENKKKKTEKKKVEGMDDARDGKGMRERMSRTREARSQLGRAGRHELQAGRCTTTTTPTRTQTYLEFLKGGKVEKGSGVEVGWAGSQGAKQEGWGVGDGYRTKE